MPRFAANLTLLFTEWAFLDRFKAASDAGFAGVECLFPYAWSAQEMAARLRDHDLQQVLFNFPAGDWQAGERGIAALPGREAEFRDGVARALSYAEPLQCQRINCLAGIVSDEADHEACWRTLIDNVRYAADKLAPLDKTVLVEAINSRVDIPGFFLDRSDRVMQLLAAVDRPNVQFQFDLYHMQIMEGDLSRSLSKYCPHIGHIQFADNPGRHEPGSGEINFSHLWRHLDQLGYRGWVSAEYHPLTDTISGLTWLPHSATVGAKTGC